jgi:hypothetical protein
MFGRGRRPRVQERQHGLERRRRGGRAEHVCQRHRPQDVEDRPMNLVQRPADRAEVMHRAVVLVLVFFTVAGRQLQSVFEQFEHLGQTDAVDWPRERVAPLHPPMADDEPLLT